MRISELLVGIGEPSKHRVAAAIQSDRALEFVNGLCVLASPVIHVTQTAVAFPNAGIDSQRLSTTFSRFVNPVVSAVALLKSQPVCLAGGGVGACVVGIDLQGEGKLRKGAPNVFWSLILL